MISTGRTACSGDDLLLRGRLPRPVEPGLHPITSATRVSSRSHRVMIPRTEMLYPIPAPLKGGTVLVAALLGGCDPSDGARVESDTMASVPAIHDFRDQGVPSGAVLPSEAELVPSVPVDPAIQETVAAYLEWSADGLNRQPAPMEIERWVGRLAGAADMAPETSEGLAARVQLVALLNVNRRYDESIPQVELLVALARAEAERLHWLAELAEVRFLALGRDALPATRAATLQAIDLALGDLADFLRVSADRCSYHRGLLERHGRLAMYGVELSRIKGSLEGVMGFLERGRSLGEIAERFGSGDTRRPAAFFDEELLIALTSTSDAAPPGELIERLEGIDRRPDRDDERFNYLGDRVLRAILVADNTDPLGPMNRAGALGVRPTRLTLERARVRCAELLAEGRVADLVGLVDWCVLHAAVETPGTQQALGQLAVLLGAAGVAAEDEALIRRAVELLLATAGAEVGDEPGAVQAFRHALERTRGS